MRHRSIVVSIALGALLIVYQGQAQSRRLSQQVVKDYQGRRVLTSFEYGAITHGQVPERARSTIEETKEVLFEGTLLQFDPAKREMTTKEVHFKNGTQWFQATATRWIRSSGDQMLRHDIDDYTTNYEFDRTGVIHACKSYKRGSDRVIAESRLLRWETGGYMVVQETHFAQDGTEVYSATLKRDPATVRVIETISEKGTKTRDFHHFETTVSTWPIADE